jgi:hypothetical protein
MSPDINKNKTKNVFLGEEEEEKERFTRVQNEGDINCPVL